MQTLREIREMLRGAGLEEGELEMQEDLWNEVRRPTLSHDRRRSVANHATGQAVPQSQPVSERNSTRPHVGHPEAGQRRQVQSPGEPMAMMSNLNSQQPSAAGGQTTTSGNQSGRRIVANSELTRDEISGLYAQLGMSRPQIFVCDSAAICRLLRRLRPDQDAQPALYQKIRDLDVLYTFEVTGDLFRFKRISYERPPWFDHLPGSDHRWQSIGAFFGRQRDWKDKVANHLRSIEPDGLYNQVRFLQEEEIGNVLREGMFTDDAWF
ncbi:hypothetical protein CBER1_04507 [Cercospora berteroae]|uniref:Uncharacterized protein n=1 Tax=Cercospora berteroae TaxID=357750 RepID=A0A2S6CF13_9PEZI|nr:hypothetical protein CBER1_04507 [Cercospora berteroae]